VVCQQVPAETIRRDKAEVEHSGNVGLTVNVKRFTDA
jgi:hypothetical protein